MSYDVVTFKVRVDADGSKILSEFHPGKEGHIDVTSPTSDDGEFYSKVAHILGQRGQKGLKFRYIDCK